MEAAAALQRGDRRVPGSGASDSLGCLWRVSQPGARSEWAGTAREGGRFRGHRPGVIIHLCCPSRSTEPWPRARGTSPHSPAAPWPSLSFPPLWPVGSLKLPNPSCLQHCIHLAACPCAAGSDPDPASATCSSVPLCCGLSPVPCLAQHAAPCPSTSPGDTDKWGTPVRGSGPGHSPYLSNARLAAQVAVLAAAEEEETPGAAGQLCRAGGGGREGG